MAISGVPYIIYDICSTGNVPEIALFLTILFHTLQEIGKYETALVSYNPISHLGT